MELFTRKHYSPSPSPSASSSASSSPSSLSSRSCCCWIIHISLLLLTLGCRSIHCGYSLQGIPTWICLGVKSPFIEFQAADEILSNISIALNTTEQTIDENGMPISASAPFIYPDDLDGFTTPRMSTYPLVPSATNFPQQAYHSHRAEHAASDRTRKTARPRPRDPYYASAGSAPSNGWAYTTTTENPIVADINSKKEVTIIEIHNEDTDPDADRSENERKYIIPLALKNPTTEEPTTSAPPKKSQLFQDASTNIDDLKRHILMLQNLTQNDHSFQSKFVVFPGLQRNGNSSSGSSVAVPVSANQAGAPQTTTTTTRRPPTSGQPLFMSRINAMRDFAAMSNGRDEMRPMPLAAEDFHHFDKITIVPQVFLQNDQMPMNDDSFETTPRESPNGSGRGGNGRRGNNGGGGRRVNQGRRKNVNRNRLTPEELAEFKRPRVPSTTAASTTTSLRTTMSTTTTTKTTTTTTTSTTSAPPASTTIATATTKDATVKPKRKGNMANGGGGKRNRNNGARKQQSPRPTQNPQYPATVATPTNTSAFAADQHHASDLLMSSAERPKALSRSARSHRQQHNINQPTTKELLFLSQLMANHTPLNSYREHTDTNPALCYTVAGLSNAQQKLCAQHTHVMPAISRGARSALQECKHQFKHRRWNCSTVDDATVFGPVTAIGSPEMAFVHALAAAGVASFIARACRDGQLATCGCSRSARPNHLHDDWTWGGCGDDLEYGYKFSQMFIDIREKEKKRGVRGLVTVPTNTKYDNLLSAANNDTTADSVANGGASSASTKESSSENGNNNNNGPIKPEDLLELQEKITKEILSSKLDESDMQDLQAKINRELLNSKVFNLENQLGASNGGRKNRLRQGASAKARSQMNLHNNEAGRRAVIKNSKITCKCHGVSGSCSLITCWQQLTSMREIGDFLREKYDEATQVKMNKRGRLQVKDSRYKVPTALDLVYLEESPDWCRSNRQLQWPGTLNRVCNKTSTGLDGCAILCCGRGYNTKKIVVKERCNCKFHWCCHVKCDTCVRVIEEYSCK